MEYLLDHYFITGGICFFMTLLGEVLLLYRNRKNIDDYFETVGALFVLFLLMSFLIWPVYIVILGVLASVVCTFVLLSLVIKILKNIP